MSVSQKKDDQPLTPRHAWQPFTPRGVAAFSQATGTRLFHVQLGIAALVAAALIACLRAAWVPVLTAAIAHLPDQGAIRQGALLWEGEPGSRLAENRMLAVVVELNGNAGLGSAADVEITFEKNRVAVCSYLGCWWRPYDGRYSLGFNRPELQPWWGAWCWPILGLAGLLTIGVLLVMWWGVGLLYLPLIKFVAFFADRGVTWSGAWRMGQAALLPGACLVAVSLLLYGYGVIDLPRFALLYTLHLVTGLVFVITSPFFLPRIFTGTVIKNPFGSPAETKPGATSPQPPGPFSGGKSI